MEKLTGNPRWLFESKNKIVCFLSLIDSDVELIVDEIPRCNCGSLVGYNVIIMNITYQATTITSLIITIIIDDILRLADWQVHMSTIHTNQFTNVTFTHHLSLCSSMVRASHRRSEGYGFDSRQGLRKVFLREQLEGKRIKKYLELGSAHDKQDV